MAAFQDAAREYAAAGIVPLPTAPNGKRPLVNHPGKFGRRAALQIAPKFPDANLGFWCGRHNGLTVVDIDITTLAEPHGGQFAGTHGRYILRSKVERLGAMEMAA